jgi:hypothetical protein
VDEKDSLRSFQENDFSVLIFYTTFSEVEISVKYITAESLSSETTTARASEKMIW